MEQWVCGAKGLLAFEKMGICENVHMGKGCMGHFYFPTAVSTLLRPLLLTSISPRTHMPHTLIAPYVHCFICPLPYFTMPHTPTARYHHYPIRSLPRMYFSPNALSPHTSITLPICHCCKRPLTVAHCLLCPLLQTTIASYVHCRPSSS